MDFKKNKILIVVAAIILVLLVYGFITDHFIVDFANNTFTGAGFDGSGGYANSSHTPGAD